MLKSSRRIGFPKRSTRVNRSHKVLRHEKVRSVTSKTRRGIIKSKTHIKLKVEEIKDYESDQPGSGLEDGGRRSVTFDETVPEPSPHLTSRLEELSIKR